MWDPQRLTTLWACTACYRDSFTYFLLRRIRKEEDEWGKQGEGWETEGKKNNTGGGEADNGDYDDGDDDEKWGEIELEGKREKRNLNYDITEG
jgi:hypothetical protein